MNVFQWVAGNVFDGHLPSDGVANGADTALDRAKSCFWFVRNSCVAYLGGGQEAERIVDAMTLCFAAMAAFRVFERCLDAALTAFYGAWRAVVFLFSSAHNALHALSSAVARTFAAVLLLTLAAGFGVVCVFLWKTQGGDRFSFPADADVFTAAQAAALEAVERTKKVFL